MCRSLFCTISPPLLSRATSGSRGIYASSYCQDPSTSLRSAQDDTKKQNFRRYCKRSTSYYLWIIKQHRIPGDDIAAVLKFQAVFFQRGDDVDAVAFDAGMHPISVTAGLSLGEGAVFANGAGIGGEDVRLYPHIPQHICHLVGKLFVLRAGSQGLVDAGNVQVPTTRHS